MENKNRAFVLDSEMVDKFLSSENQNSKKSMERFFLHKPKNGVVTPRLKDYKIIDGSILLIGDKISTTQLKVDQHFNWFQKLMWKWCFGVEVEDYSEV